MAHLLEVKQISTCFRTDEGIARAVDGVSFHVDEGEIISFVGESGCGKSVLQMSILQLISPPGEVVEKDIFLDGVKISSYSATSDDLCSVRGGKIGMIFQEPMTSLNPVLKIGNQIMESIRIHLNLPKGEARKRTLELLNMVGIPDCETRFDYYPHQFSGGMRQRVMIAMVLAANPKIIIADEATTALDVTTQSQLLELFKEIVKKTRTALVIVTHNLGVVARYADRIYIMYAGKIIEKGTVKEVFLHPAHPYTRALLRAVPRLDDSKDRVLTPISGLPPNLAELPENCYFAARCRYKTDLCERTANPALRQVSENHFSACLRALDDLDEREKELTVEGERRVTSRRIAEEHILDVKGVSKLFKIHRGFLQRSVSTVHALDNVDIYVRKGETLGLVGESGCGKTTLAKSILRLHDVDTGSIVFEGTDITRLDEKGMIPFRAKLGAVFQDPFSSLDPRDTAGSIVGEPLLVHKLCKSDREYEEKVATLFTMVNLDPSFKDRYPHEFSGGQRQRLGVARALASNPSLIICDEPISALDVSIQAQLINLLEDLQHKLGLSYLFIAHDISVVKHISDRIVVMYAGCVVEVADCETLCSAPLHPYTRALIAAIPIPDPFVDEKRKIITLKGEIPSLEKRPSGCGFHDRCMYATAECKVSVPPLIDDGKGHKAACINLANIPMTN